jgi:pilus assembly protein Flp/PilA
MHTGRSENDHPREDLPWAVIVARWSSLCNHRCEGTTNMNTIAKFAQRLRHDDRGVTALEYGLIAAVMGALIVLAFTTFGDDLSTAFGSIGGLLTSTASGM